MKTGFKFQVSEGCTKITPDGEKEKLRHRLLVSVMCYCCIEYNLTGFQCIKFIVTSVRVAVLHKSEDASSDSFRLMIPETTRKSTTQL